MNTKLILLPALAAMATPGLSYAQATEQSQTITVNGEVAQACMLGAPANSTLQLGALTGTDGRLKPDLTSTAVAASTSIANAWCNTPNKITLKSSPMTTSAPTLVMPSNFAREIAFTATLTGWTDPVVNTALTADRSVDGISTTPQAANPLTVAFSALTPVVGGAPKADNFIVAGDYSATVTITLAVGN